MIQAFLFAEAVNEESLFPFQEFAHPYLHGVMQPVCHDWKISFCWPCFFTLSITCHPFCAGTATIFATFTAAGIIITITGSKQNCAD